jgi:hypothetical protein
MILNGACRQYSGHQTSLAGAAQYDPFETFMTTSPGEPLRRKADDQVQYNPAVMFCA